MPEEAIEALNAKGTYLAMLVLAMMVDPICAEDDGPKPRLQGVGVDELLLVTTLVCIATVGLWELMKWVVRGVVNFFKETPKQRKLRKLRDAAKAAAEEEVDRAVLERGIQELPPPPPEPIPITRTTRRVKTLSFSSSSDVPAPPPPPPAETFMIYPERGFWKTTSARSKLHTDPQCHGLRNAGDIHQTEYCAYCQNRTPLYTKGRTLQPAHTF